MPDFYFVFDVESAGLHGEGFAVGFVVVDDNGNEMDYGLRFCSDIPECPDENLKWLKENVMPALPTENSHFMEWSTRAVRDYFWRAWVHWKEKGAVMVSDCAWPVEARFLAACVDDVHQEREWEGPYPLLDVSSFLLAASKNPIDTFSRQADELPAHNPLCDARQSARIFFETLKELKEQRKPPDSP